MRKGSVAAALLGLVGLAMGGTAWANPFYVGRYRGLRGGPVDDSAWNVYWNPAGLAKTGGSVALNVQAITRRGTYDREAALNDIPAEAVDVNSGFNKTGALGVVPGIAVRHGWALDDFDIGLGGTFFVARAGTSAWDKTPGASGQHPGAVDGPQRWATISTAMSVLSVGVGAGVRYKPWGLSLGITPVMNFANLSTVRARNLDQREDLYQPDGRLKEGRILLDGATDERLSWIAGLRWAPNDSFDLGLSWHGGATYDLQGNALIQTGSDPEQQVQSRLPLQVAQSVRAGVRVVALPWLVLRPELAWHQWSVMDKQVALNNSPGDPGFGDELIPLYRLFQDTWAAKLSADFPVHDRLTLHAAAGYESAANRSTCSAGLIRTVKPNHEGTEDRNWCTFEPGLAESAAVEAGVGLSVKLPAGVTAMLSYTLQQFEDVRATGSIQSPTTNGTYTDRRQYFSLDLEYAWGEEAAK